MSSDPYTQVADRFGYAASPEFHRLLEHLMTPLQAEIASRLPNEAADLAPQIGRSVDEVRAQIREMFVKGLVFARDFDTLENPRFAKNLVQLHDATQSVIFWDVRDHQTLYDLWEAFCKAGYDDDYGRHYLAYESPPSRIVPAYRSVKDNPDLTPAEDVREILKHVGRIAVVSCSCRKRALAEHRECDRSVDQNCLVFGRGAEYALKRGSGRELTYADALAVIDATEQDGLVHSWANNDTLVGGIMCNCCHDCCVDWARLTAVDVPITKRWAKSRFQATINEAACNGCQDCVDRCQFDAIEMQRREGSKRLKAVVIDANCFGCGVCAVTCSEEAISMATVRPLSHIPARA